MLPHQNIVSKYQKTSKVRTKTDTNWHQVLNIIRWCFKGIIWENFLFPWAFSPRKSGNSLHVIPSKHPRMVIVVPPAARGNSCCHCVLCMEPPLPNIISGALMQFWATFISRKLFFWNSFAPKLFFTPPQLFLTNAKNTLWVKQGATQFYQEFFFTVLNCLACNFLSHLWCFFVQRWLLLALPLCLALSSLCSTIQMGIAYFPCVAVRCQAIGYH